jgi:hypothetical protein
MARYFQKMAPASARSKNPNRTILRMASLVLGLLALHCGVPFTGGGDDDLAQDSEEAAALIDCVAAAKAAGLDFLGSRPAAGNPDLFTASSVTTDKLKACPTVTYTIEAAANSSIASAKAAEMYRAGALYAAPAHDAPEGQEWIAIGFFRDASGKKRVPVLR